MFCWHNKRILLAKYEPNIFVDLTKLFSQCCSQIIIFQVGAKLVIGQKFGNFHTGIIITIPYYGTISANIKRVLNKYQINTIYRINFKLNRLVRLGKDPISSSEKNNVVYKFNCKCGKTYVDLCVGFHFLLNL